LTAGIGSATVHLHPSSDGGAQDRKMPHESFDRSREERNLPDRRRAAVEESIDTEQIQALRSVDSASGSPLFRINLHSKIGPRRFVVNVSSPGGDWIARATDDNRAREVALYLARLPELLPRQIDWPALAAR
jgi:hypothetical protein